MVQFENIAFQKHTPLLQPLTDRAGMFFSNIVIFQQVTYVLQVYFIF